MGPLNPYEIETSQCCGSLRVRYLKNEIINTLFAYGDLSSIMLQYKILFLLSINIR